MASAATVSSSLPADNQTTPQKAIQHKSWLARSRAWVSMLFLLPAMVVVLLSHNAFPLESYAEMACTLTATALFLVGCYWRWWATLYISGVKDKKLICQGPYSMCRNPLYFGTFLLTMSVAFALQSVTLAVAMIIVSLYYLGVTIPNEETRLEGWFGDAYREYKREVPRFWPKFSNYHSDENLSIALVGIRAELIRSLRYICIPLVCHALLHLRAHDWWPNFFSMLP